MGLVVTRCCSQVLLVSPSADKDRSHHVRPRLLCHVVKPRARSLLAESRQKVLENDCAQTLREMRQNLCLMRVYADDPMRLDRRINLECATTQRVVCSKVIIVNYEMINPGAAGIKRRRLRAAISWYCLGMPFIRISCVAKRSDDVFRGVSGCENKQDD